MTENRMPAVSLAAVAGRRQRTVDLAAEIERRGFSGIFCPSLGDAMSLCLSIAHATETDRVRHRHPADLLPASGRPGLDRRLHRRDRRRPLPPSASG